METTQMVSNSTDVTPGAGAPALLRLATVWIDLKPERVQDTLAADNEPAVSLGLGIEQPQTVTFSLSASGLAVTFSNLIGNAGGAGSAVTSATAAQAA
jgi:hypothetical protein